jgi:hypothetical protein
MIKEKENVYSKQEDRVKWTKRSLLIILVEALAELKVISSKDCSQASGLAS